jgi:hypothetical protein
MTKSVNYRLMTEGFKHRTLYHISNFQTPDHSNYWYIHIRGGGIYTNKAIY